MVNGPELKLKRKHGEKIIRVLLLGFRYVRATVCVELDLAQQAAPLQVRSVMKFPNFLHRGVK